VPDEVSSVVGVERAAFPAGFRIVYSAVHAARVETKRIWDAQIRPSSSSRVQRQQRIRVGASGEGRVRTES
jgi:hypothetical protein